MMVSPNQYDRTASIEQGWGAGVSEGVAGGRGAAAGNRQVGQCEQRAYGFLALICLESEAVKPPVSRTVTVTV